MSARIFPCLLVILGCGGGPPPQGPLGIPDAMHGPSTDADIDGDGVPNANDNCPSLANTDQRMACNYPFPAPAPEGELVPDTLARLNFYRSLVGLRPVTESVPASIGCTRHLEYLAATSRDMGGAIISYDEDPASPHATDEGRMAAPKSVLSFGANDIVDAIDSMFAGLYQRLPLLHPGLRTIGVAYYRDPVQPMWTWACIEVGTGTDRTVHAPYPILWPPPDVQVTGRTASGMNTFPCPTHADPLDGRICDTGAGIATVSLFGLGAIASPMGSIKRISPESSIDLFETWFAGGPTPHEMMGFLNDSIALVPDVTTMYVRTQYEARVDATVAGTAQTYRWRFNVNGVLNDDLACDLLGEQGTFDDAIDVNAAEVDGRICENPDFYHFQRPGTYAVTLTYDPSRGDLDLYAYDESRAPVQMATGLSSPAMLTNLNQGYFEVRGANGDIGPYGLLIEQLTP